MAWIDDQLTERLQRVRLDAAGMQRLAVECNAEGSILHLCNSLIAICNTMEDALALQAIVGERERA
jgi:hypothetical protein